MTPQADDDFPQPERPKIRLRKDMENLAPDAPPQSSPPTSTPVEVTLQQAAQAARRLSSWEDIETLAIPSKHKVATFVGVLVVLGLGLGLSWPTALVGTIIAFALASTFGRLAGVLAELQVPRRYAALAAFGVTLVTLVLVMLVWAPVWQRQAAQYGARLSALAGDLAGTAEKHAVGEPAHWVVRAAGATETAIDTSAAIVAGRHTAVFFQLVLLVGALTALGVFRPKPDETGGLVKTWRVVGNILSRIFTRIGFAVSGRLAKAVALGVLAGIGLEIAGVPAAWFVAGCVMALALVVRPVTVVLVVGALPMIAWNAGWARPVGIVVGTGVALFFAEKKLHWHLYLRPALAAGLILPEIQGGEGAGSGRRLLGGVWQIVRLASSLAALGLIVGLLWVCVPGYQQHAARTKAIEAATTNEQLLKLLDRYPNDPEVFLKLVEAPDTTNALKYAEMYANWKPQPPEATELREKLYQRLLSYFPSSAPKYNRTEGYEILLDRIPFHEAPDDPRRDLAQKIVALSPDNVTAWNALANDSLVRNEPDQAVEYAERAVKLAPGNVDCRAVLADAYMAKKDWAKVIAECDAALALQPDNSRAWTMRATAVQAQQKKLK